jgi:hypothetical protein
VDRGYDAVRVGNIASFSNDFSAAATKSEIQNHRNILPPA